MAKKSKIFFKAVVIIILVLFLLSIDISSGDDDFSYGVSFSRFHSDELNLDWKETYLAVLDDLGARHLRFSAHWPITEPEEGKYNFEELDFQIAEAEKRNAKVILAVGRRLPGWPECHVPDWASGLSWEDQKPIILNLIEETVNRYKDSRAIKYWQVENEPYLIFFANFICGDLDKEFLSQEIDLVRKLDPSRQIIITDSGEFGSWFQAYKKSDVFGTSMYLYIWQRQIGPVRYPIMPAFFRIKHNLVKLFNNKKPSIVIELSAEPWLLQPIIETSIEVQMDRMGIDKFDEVVNFSQKTGFNEFYLWGAEWWYWLKLNGHDEHWKLARKLFKGLP